VEVNFTTAHAVHVFLDLPKPEGGVVRVGHLADEAVEIVVGAGFFAQRVLQKLNAYDIAIALQSIADVDLVCLAVEVLKS
jgi:hypothetical protein